MAKRRAHSSASRRRRNPHREEYDDYEDDYEEERRPPPRRVAPPPRGFMDRLTGRHPPARRAPAPRCAPSPKVERALKDLVSALGYRTNPRQNPSYKAKFEAAADAAAVKRALRAAGYTGVRLRSSEPGAKRAPGAYALFVKSKMPALMARRMSAAEAMREVASLWRNR